MSLPDPLCLTRLISNRQIVDATPIRIFLFNDLLVWTSLDLNFEGASLHPASIGALSFTRARVWLGPLAGKVALHQVDPSELAVLPGFCVTLQRPKASGAATAQDLVDAAAANDVRSRCSFIMVRARLLILGATLVQGEMVVPGQRIATLVFKDEREVAAWQKLLLDAVSR